MIEDTIDLRSITNLLKRQIKIIVLVIVSVMVLAVIYVISQPPKYAATALIQVSPIRKNILSQEDQPQNFNINNVWVDGEIEILRSDAVLQGVVERAGLSSDSDTPQQQLTRAIRDFQKISSVERRGQTYILAAKVTADTAPRAAELVNIWVESYISHQIAVKVAAIRQIETLISERLSRAQQVLLESESNIDQYIFANIDTISAAANSDELTRLVIEFERLQGRIPQTLPTETPALQDRINDLTQNSSNQNEPEIGQISSNRNTLELQQNIRSLVLQSDLPLEIVAGIYTLQQEANIARLEYDTILERRRSLALQAGLQIADSRLISPALPPIAPSTKAKKNILVVAALIAVFLAFLVAIFKEFWVGGFTTEAQLSRNLAVRVAARIPEISQNIPKNAPEVAIAKSFVEAPMSPYAEAIRRLRVAVDQSLSRQDSSANLGKIIMVTSSVPGEGKSSTSLALARAFAQSGKSTLLIDCDFRQPKLHKILDLNRQNSLFASMGNPHESIEDIDLYRDETTLEALLGETGTKGFTDQVFKGQRFLDFIETSRKTYEFIILDTPPLLPIIDSAHLANISDVIALTVKWASTRQHDVRSSLKILRDSKNPDAEIIAFLSQEKFAESAYSYGNYAYQKP